MSRHQVYVLGKRAKAKLINLTMASVMAITGIGGGLPLLLSQTALAASTTVCATSCDADSIQAVIDAASPGDTITLGGNASLSHELTINKSLTFNGNGFTISPAFSYTSTSNNASIGIIGTSNVTLENLVENGAGGSNLHGVNVYESTGVTLTNDTLKNNSRDGLVVNGSSVSVSGLTTSGNGWGGIDVDQGSGVTTPASLTITGTSSLNDTFPIVVDHPSNPNVSVTDQTNTYVPTQLGGSFVYTTNDSKFLYTSTYSRANNASDTEGSVQVPAATTAVRFAFTGATTVSNIAGVEHLQAGQWPNATGEHQYRVQEALPAGTYTVTAAFQTNDGTGNWYPVNGSQLLYVLGNPTGSFVFPTASNNYFRPSDNPLRVNVGDANDSFRDVVFTIGGTNYEVDRAQCDQREAGNYLLCDIDTASNWSNLSAGTYTATATLYNQASNHTTISSISFIVDGTAPTLSNLTITNPHAVYNSPINVKATATDDNAVGNVTYTITAPRVSDGVCDGNGTSAITPVVVTTGTNGVYSASLNTSGLNGTYCIDATAEDLATNHSAVLTTKVTIDNTAPTLSNVKFSQPGTTYIKDGTGIYLTFTASEPLGTLPTVTFDGVPAQSIHNTSGNNYAAYLWENHNLPQGPIALSISYQDIAGNQGQTVTSTTDGSTIIVDRTPPVITVKSGYVGNKTFHIYSNVSFSLHDNYAAAKYVINGHTVSFTQNQWSDANLQNIKQYLHQGLNTITLYDAAGNSSSYIFIYDNVVPTTSITGASQSALNTISFSGTVSDPDLNYYYCYLTTDQAITVGNTTYTAGEEVGTRNAHCQTTWASGHSSFSGTLGSFDITSLPTGSYTVNLVAYDLAGNNNASAPTTFGVAVNHTAPSGLANLSPADDTQITTANQQSISWTTATPSSESQVSYYYESSTSNLVKGDGSFVSPIYTSGALNTNSIATPNTPEGTYYWHVKACDFIGNCSAWTSPWKLIIDDTAPVVVIESYGTTGNVVQPLISVDNSTTPAAGYAYSWTTNPNVTISSTSALNPTFTVNADGTYTFDLTVTDIAGNSTTTPFTFTYTAPKPANSGPTNSGVTGASTTVGGTQTPLTNNGTGTTTPQTASTAAVLGDNTTAPSGQVKGDSTQKPSASTGTSSSTKHSGTFLGLGWWWLLILAVLGALWFIFAGTRRKQDN